MVYIILHLLIITPIYDIRGGSRIVGRGVLMGREGKARVSARDFFWTTPTFCDIYDT